MQLALCFDVGRMSILGSFKNSEVCSFAAVRDRGYKPVIAMLDDAKQPGRACALGLPLVLGVGLPAYLAKICKGVVGFVAVDVVNLLRRPFAGHVQPCKAVSHGASAVKHDVDVSILTQRPSRHASLFASVVLQVCELTSFLAVMCKLAQSVLCDHVAPHQSGKSSKDAASGDESPVPRRVSCRSILPCLLAKASKCVKIEALSRPGHQQLIPAKES